jgi:hypothetical protein
MDLARANWAFHHVTWGAGRAVRAVRHAKTPLLEKTRGATTPGVWPASGSVAEGEDQRGGRAASQTEVAPERLTLARARKAISIATGVVRA